ncbi:MAG TPA: BBP7 family outer membrane beta-barrel protein [Gemmataceae bacterium]|jgi:hypothetical protein|nr:BBP7 family outer membrane beta-barrel protein [Gemmataceae bacterium]
MRNGFLGSLAVWLAGAGFVLAQPAHLTRNSSSAADPAPAGTPPGTAAPSMPGLPSDSQNPVLPWEPGWVNNMLGVSYGQFQASAEYLLWFNKNFAILPPLILTTGGKKEDGDPSLVGGTTSGIDFGLMSGIRIGLTYWLEDCQSYGLQGSFFILPQRTLEYRTDSSFALTRRIFNLNNQIEDNFIVAFPGIASGTALIQARSKTWGLEANLWRNIVDEPILEAMRLDVMVGFRYIDLSEDIFIDTTSSFNRNLQAFPEFLPFAGNHLSINDSFSTANQFYGGQVGVSAKFHGDLGVVSFLAKLGVGNTHESVFIRGNQIRTRADGTTVISPGGVLALASNSGSSSREQFTLVPEFGFQWSLPLTKYIDFNLGYSLIFLNNVLRPSDQIDQGVDVSQINNLPRTPLPLGLNRPAVPFVQSSYYVQGFNIGLELRW